MLKPPKSGYEKVANDHALSDDDFLDVDEKSKEEFIITSKWDSKMFAVKPTTPREQTFKLSDYFNEHIHRRTVYLVLPTFGIVSIATIIVSIIWMMNRMSIYTALWIMISLNWLVAAIGMFGVYRWGSVEGVLEFFKGKNNEMTTELHHLDITKKTLKKEAKNIHFQVGKLKNHGRDLQENMEKFDKLRAELQKISGKNEDLTKMLDELNKQHDDWQDMIYENEKAHLFSLYYKASLRDGEHGLSKKEYQRFLATLSSDTRHEFKLQGGFEFMDKNNDEIVDAEEFQSMVEHVLEVINNKKDKLIEQRQKKK